MRLKTSSLWLSKKNELVHLARCCEVLLQILAQGCPWPAIRRRFRAAAFIASWLAVCRHKSAGEGAQVDGRFEFATLCGYKLRQRRE